ncbi:MAG: diaminopimelate epimerase, partial [Acidobacteriota bacterium]|nr:diaminopimelate epimerase [Acidobacteriota bacterium]
MTTSLHFWKMSGAGNDFVVVDARAGLPAPAGELAAQLCRRRVGIGADGLLAVQGVSERRVVVDYRNA